MVRPPSESGVPRRRGSSGFSLVELMIALGLLVVVVAFLLETFTDQQRAYVVVDEVSQAQGNARAVSELLERDLREAGYKVPERMAVCGLDQTAGPDALMVSATDILDTVDPLLPLAYLQPDWAARVVAAGAGTVSLDVADIDGNGTTDFREGMGIILADLDDPAGQVACAEISGPVVAPGAPGNPWVVPVTLVAGALPMGGDRRAVPAHYYRIQNGDELWRDDLRLVSDVEDFQVAYFFDADEDGVVDGNEMHGDGQGATPTYDPTGVDHETLRDVRVNLVFTTATPDPRRAYGEGIGQVTENRDPATVAAADGLRRRIHTANVRVRNVGTR